MVHATSIHFSFLTRYFCVLLQADVSSEQISTLLEATGNTEVEAFYPIIFSNFLSDPEKIAQLIATPGGAGGGGGGGGGKFDGRRELHAMVEFLVNSILTRTSISLHNQYSIIQVVPAAVEKARPRKKRRSKKKRWKPLPLICSEAEVRKLLADAETDIFVFRH